MLSSKKFRFDAYIIIMGYILIDILLYLSNIYVLCDTISYNIPNQKKTLLNFATIYYKDDNLYSLNNRRHSSKLINSYYFSNNKIKQLYYDKNIDNFSTVTTLPFSISFASVKKENANNENRKKNSHYQLFDCHQLSTIKTRDSNEKHKNSIVSSSLINSTKYLNSTNFVNKVNEKNFINLSSEKYYNKKRYRRHLINDDNDDRTSTATSKNISDSITRSTNSSSNYITNSSDGNTSIENIVATLTTILPSSAIASINFLPPESNNVETIIGSAESVDGSSNNNNEYMIDIGGTYDNITCTDESCINHNITCVGDPLYCNYTYEEYVEMLYDYIYPTIPEWILIASHAVVFFMGLVGNALVCIAVYTNYTMRTVTNIFIVNLAVADFFVILFCLPPTVVWDVTETWFMGETMCKVVLYFQTVSVTVSVLTLTFISIDRWYAICFPLRYVSTNVRAIGSIGFIWFVALLSDVPEFVYSTTKHKELRFGISLFTQCVSTWEKNTEKYFYIARFIVLYILPLFMMTIAYFQIVRVLWKSDTIPGHRESRNQTYTCGYLRPCGPAANSSTMGQLRARRKAAKMLVAVVVMFASCYFPVHVLNILRYTIDIGQNEVVTVLSLFSHWLCYANSAVNPVIYNFMSGKFRREFRNALEKCRCGRARIEDRSLYHSTPATRINNISPSSRSNYQLTSVRDITSLRDRQTTIQTSFVENCGNGLHDISPPKLTDDRQLHAKYDNGA